MNGPLYQSSGAARCVTFRPGVPGEESPSKAVWKEASSSTTSALPLPPPYTPLATQPMVGCLNGRPPSLGRSSKECQKSSWEGTPAWAKKVKEVVHNYLDMCLVQMSLKFGHAYARLKGTCVATNKKIKHLEAQLGEVNKKLFSTNNEITELKRRIEDMPSIAKQEEDLEDADRRVREMTGEKEALGRLLFA
uniref:Uncharacterized protein n=1 Tax=Cannabis sativa TaxID=3483 RepID=A0A803PCP9_CANSA